MDLLRWNLISLIRLKSHHPFQTSRRPGLYLLGIPELYSPKEFLRYVFELAIAIRPALQCLKELTRSFLAKVWACHLGPCFDIHALEPYFAFHVLLKLLPPSYLCSSHQVGAWMSGHSNERRCIEQLLVALLRFHQIRHH